MACSGFLWPKNNMAILSLIGGASRATCTSPSIPLRTTGRSRERAMPARQLTEAADGEVALNGRCRKSRKGIRDDRNWPVSWVWVTGFEPAASSLLGRLTSRCELRQALSSAQTCRPSPHWAWIIASSVSGRAHRLRPRRPVAAPVAVPASGPAAPVAVSAP